MARGNRGGKRAGPRRPREAAARTRPPLGRLLLLALGVTLTAVAWGYLVVAAIDFGAAARSGETNGWWFLAAASLGAVACLFTALLLLARIVRLLGRRDAPAYASRHSQSPSDRRGDDQSTSGTRRS